MKKEWLKGRVLCQKHPLSILLHRMKLVIAVAVEGGGRTVVVTV